jgi:hypothetical protein
MKEKKTRKRRILECFFSGVFIALALILLIFFLNRWGIFPLPQIISDFFNFEKGEVDQSYYDEERFYEFLSNNTSSDTEIKEVKLTVDNVSEFIRAIPVYSNYYWEIESQMLYSDKSTLYEYTIHSHNERYRIDEIHGNKNLTTVKDSEETVIRDNVTLNKRTIIGDTDFSFENLISIADIDFYLSSPDSVIKEARLIDTDTEKYLFVEFYTETLRKTDEFYISLDYGVVLFAMSRMGEEIVFTQKTNSFNPNYTPSDALFKI